MGSLHEGHLSLVRIAGDLADRVVVSVFVNPIQFGDAGDLHRYPRDLERDARLLADAGADLMFAPSLEEVYPPGETTRVSVPGVSDPMEGTYRPGHFVGVATVVSKLFAGIRPDLAVFGRKDAQQLAVVRRMTLDLRLPVEIVAAPTIRERDGLALSSRNVHLDGEARAEALGLSRGLFAAADLIEEGERHGGPLLEAIQGETEHIRLDYAELADQETMELMGGLGRPAILAVAGQVGDVRLIDNIAIDFEDGDTPVIDRGVFLDVPSVLYSIRPSSGIEA